MLEMEISSVASLKELENTRVVRVVAREHGCKATTPLIATSELAHRRHAKIDHAI
jgi:hypothetical protein